MVVIMTNPSSGKENPYLASPSNGPPERIRTKEKHQWWPFIIGAAWSVLSAFPIAALLALVFRFPVPLIGYVSGVEAVIPALVAVLVYGVLFGGFLILGGLGSCIVFVVNKNSVGNVGQRKWIIAILAMSTTLASLLLLATLDKFIGPW